MSNNWRNALAENLLLLLSGIYMLVSLLSLVLRDMFTSMIANNLFDMSVYLVTSVPVMLFGVGIFMIMSIRKQRFKRAFALAALPWMYGGLIFAMLWR